MKHMKIFGTLAEMQAFLATNPAFGVLAMNTETGSFAAISSSNEIDPTPTPEQTYKFIGDHGGMLATYEFTGTNNVIGGYKLYTNLNALYVDGEVFDLDDLIVVTGSGSGSGSTSGSASGSGSGAKMSGISLPDGITGDHELEFVLEKDDEGHTDIRGGGWFDNCPTMISVTLPYFINGKK